MSAKIVNIEPHDPNSPFVVELLEDLLARARRGEFDWVAVVAGGKMSKGSSTGEIHRAGHARYWEIAGGLASLQRLILEESEE